MNDELMALLTQHIAATQENTEALRAQNELLVAIVAQNADLIDGMGGSQDGDDEPTTDLAGRPL